ncbi:MAG TPA: hypothetical protein VK361_00525 [Rubrobacteraceae bacterium]|nr:hypothetical protein [Rubrobacteraceae bacterium]
MTTSQAASKLNKTRQGVTWMVENKKLRAAKTPLGWLIDPKSVEAVRASGKEESGR